MYNDIFSEKYDEFMGREHIDLYKKFIGKYIKNSSSILDCGCGTWELIFLFSGVKEKYGIDISNDLLSIAKQKNPDTVFINVKLQEFSIWKKFDIVISSFDVINHILTLTDWDKFFYNSSNHISRKWFFFFDMNTLYKFKSIDNNIIKNTVDDYTLEIFTKRSSKNPQIMNFFIKIYDNKSDVVIYEEKISEITFSKQIILKILRKYFSRVIIDPEYSGKNRLFFVCQK